MGALHGDQWPADPVWIVGVQLDTGHRVVFGRDGSRTVTPAQAVQASCAIPAYFEPAEIDGPKYVDGRVHSTTNADLVVPERPEVVLVNAPMSAARSVRNVDRAWPSATRPPVAGPGGRRHP